jgi:hypothetical protein
MIMKGTSKDYKLQHQPTSKQKQLKQMAQRVEPIQAPKTSWAEKALGRTTSQQPCTKHPRPPKSQQEMAMGED